MSRELPAYPERGRVVFRNKALGGCSISLIMKNALDLCNAYCTLSATLHTIHVFTHSILITAYGEGNIIMPFSHRWKLKHRDVQ